MKTAPTFVLEERAELVRSSSDVRIDPDVAGDPSYSDDPPTEHLWHDLSCLTRFLLSFLAVLTLQGGVAQVIFTEYVEGSSHNKALEIGNVGAEPFDLSTCRIEMYFNGDDEAGQTFDLQGVVEPGRAHVFRHRDSNGKYDEPFEAVTATAPSVQEAGFGWVNGNDAIVLRCGGAVTGSLGQIGEDGYWGKDVTMRRSSGPADTNPDDEWAPAPGVWTELDRNTFDGLGQP